MDLDTAKENIQPLAGGRNIRYLEAALNASSCQDLQKQRQEHEDAIRNYEGPDPLAPWFEYILWIEQSYPSGGKESGLEEVLLKCLTTFESDIRYLQDRRMIKLYIKYIDSQPSPQEYYQELYNQGIGTMVADLYICWAYYYELCGNFKKADSIFRKGLDARAQPFDEIDQAHKHFGFTMSQRILYPEETSQEEFIASLRERRYALTSLKHHRKKVGSIRTGSAIKSHNPGKVQIDQARPGTSRNVAVSVLEDENKDPNPIPPPVINETLSESSHSQSVIKSIIDSARKKENMREPGPWSKAKMHNQKKGSLFGPSGSNSTHLGFEILEDEEYVDAPILCPQHQNNYTRGIQLPENHTSQNLPQKIWFLPLILETEITPNSYPMYEKFHLYPKPGHEYSLEEFTAYKWFTKRNIKNKLTQRQDPFWANDYSVGIRLYPNYAKNNLPGKDLNVNRFLPEENILSGQCRLEVKVSEIYPENSCYEYQFEEILREKWKSGERKLKYNCNETIIMSEEMDETRIVVDAYGRKSIFPSRKSLAAGMYARKSVDRRQTVLNDSEKDGYEKYTVKRQTVLNDTLKLLNCQTILNNTEKQINETLSNKQQVSFHVPDESVNASLKQQTILSDTEKEVNQILAESNNSFRRSVIMPNPLKNGQDISTKEENHSITDKLQGIDRNEKFNKSSTETVKPSTKDFDNSNKNPVIVECNNFAIYEDEDFAFKAPPPPRQTKFQIFEEEDNETISSPLFAANETCSTQTFNFFIKSQSVSTPKNIKKNTSYCNNPTTSNTLQSVGVQQQIEHQFAPATLSPSETELVIQAKQLSTIMEITETQTGSSATAGITRLMDSQAQSPETDGDASKIQQISKACLGVSPDYDVSSKIAEPIKRMQEKEQREETVPNMMMSLKLFEEKTETIPKVMLAPQQHIDSDFYSIFVKTPEKKQTVKTGVEFSVNDSMTFSNIKDLALPVIGEVNKIQTVQKNTTGPSKELNESIVPGFEDFDLRTKKNQNTESAEAGKLEKSSEIKLSFLEPSIKNKQPELPLPNRFSKPKSTENHTNNDSLVGNEASLDKSCKDQVPPSHIPIFTRLSRISRGAATSSDQSTKKSLMSKEYKEKSFIESNKKSMVSDEPLLDLEPSTSILNKSQVPAQKERTSVFEQSKVLEKTLPPNKIVAAENISRKSVRNNDFFEDNIRTDAFTPNISGIKNSTWLPNYQPKISFLEEKSFHIKSEKSNSIEEETTSTCIKASEAETSILNIFSKLSKRQMTAPEIPQNDISISLTEDEYNENMQMKNQSHYSLRKSIEVVDPPEHFPPPIAPVIKSDILEDNNKDDGDLGRSIYFTNTPKTPLRRRHHWNDDDNENQSFANNIRTVDLDRTRQVIDEHLVDINVNPFDNELIRAFLEKIDFCSYLDGLPNCNFVDKINALKKYDVIAINSKKFEITKIIGEGSYGTVLCGRDSSTGKIYALKQEKPANLWEYYICLELKSRIQNIDILHGFMEIEYALIGNNASVLISEFSKYGSLITVCNKIKRTTGKNIDEYIVMILTSQMLSIIDHLHASNIIHADIKPDNILLMSKLNYDRKQLAVQLIDFGVSIDLALFPKGQKFTYIHPTLDFQCVEMREKRSWTFQTDLYGLAGIIHVLLFGKYMDLIEKPTGWTHKSIYPRYFNKAIWQSIFHSLLNIIDCNAMPNLQNLKTQLDAEIALKERLVRDKISEFNLTLE